MANDKYIVPVVAKALDILALLDSPARELALAEIVRRSGTSHSTAFRILHTLAERGYVTRVGRRYRRAILSEHPKIGFATLGEDAAISDDIAHSLQKAVIGAGYNLLLLNNGQDPQQAIENARRFVAEKVSIAIEFQNSAEVSAILADIYREAGIPVIAVHVPQPGAIYFGPDNFRAGRSAGTALGEYAAEHWSGHYDTVLLLDLPAGGSIIQARLTGVLAGIELVLGPVTPRRVVRVPGGEDLAAARSATAEILRTRNDGSKILIAGINDDFALGALEAVRSAGLEKSVAIVGHDGSKKALAVIAQNGVPLIGTVGFFPEDYGSQLVSVASRILSGDQIGPAVYVEHKLITRSLAKRCLELAR